MINVIARKDDDFFFGQLIPRARSSQTHLAQISFTPTTREEAQLEANRRGLRGKPFQFDDMPLVQRLQDERNYDDTIQDFLMATRF